MLVTKRFLPFIVALLASSITVASGEVSCAGDVDPSAFNRCRVCHGAAPGAAQLAGPNLWGIIGRQSGTVPGYTYSDAITSSGVTWTAATLRAYLADPSGYLPGTRMMAAPLTDDDVVDDIVCYLRATSEPLDKPAVPQNDNIARWARGSYDYLMIEDGSKRGWERFELMVHPDGSRTLLMWHDLAARNAQFSIILRADASFRPQEAYLNYWVEDGYKGSALIRVDGDKLHIESHGAGGDQSLSIDVPEEFSIGTHPVAGDGWHLYQMQRSEQRVANIYTMEASADLSRPLIGSLVEMPFAVVGDEVITTPAGTFDTTHYQLAGRFDVWLMGEDRLMVKMRNEPRGFEYVLRSFESSE